MSRKKLVRVPSLDKASTRIAGLKSISPDLDLGNDVTTANYEAVAIKTRQKIELYNETLSKIDDMYNDCFDQIKTLNDWNEKVLIAVANKFGLNSSQYEMAGGVRKSERKRKQSTKNKEAK